MRILAVESSAGPASAALWEDGQILAQRFQNNGFTHSVTLLPMVDEVLRERGLRPGDVDAFAVACGPGSFTGLRIGVGTVKGLAFAAEKGCIAVSTLEAMAYQHTAAQGIVCPCMDARRSQFYTALFEATSGGVRRLTADGALSAQELFGRLAHLHAPVLLVGDGSALAYTMAPEELRPYLTLAPEPERYQNAVGVALAAANGVRIPAEELRPNYLRLAQAERERAARLAAQGKME